MALRRLFILVALSPLLLAVDRLAADPPGKGDGLLVITLNPAARIKNPVARLGDLATLNGPAFLRDRAAALDLAERTSAASTSLITRQEVYYRLLLAGFESKLFRLAGPPHITLRWDETTVKTTPVSLPAETPPADQPVLIKPREIVRLVAKIGAVRVTALAEAQQEGRLGQTIRVRNVDSNKIISGKVVDRNMVEVVY